ncbi:MAG: 2-oxo acid dehydrogenase subunit E2 [Flavobacteriaceae bacterium]|nr:2-oxo acid dehydrogenase subunit E2 [Flavobacteriaceae bacterium]
MARFELKLPKMGESVAEATITNWLKSVGDSVEMDEAILEIATDKVDSEVPTEVSGVLVEQLFAVDDVVEVGSVLAIIETEEADDSTGDQEPSNGDQEPTVDDNSSEPSAEVVQAVSQPLTQAQESADLISHSSSQGRFYSPLVRNIAQQEGISQTELDAMVGSGKDGRVTKNDILAYIDQRKSSDRLNQDKPQPDAINASQFNESLTAAKAVTVSSHQDDEIIEMTRMGKLIAKHMTASVATSAHVQSFVECDVTKVWQWREGVKKSFEAREGEKLTFTPIFMEAVARALRDFPMMNISVEGDKIIKHKAINLGMAAALDDGNLIVPVIKNADQLNLVGMSKAVNDLARRARANKLTPDEIAGGTYTVTNVGNFGSIMGTPIINQPQVGILALGAIRKVPAVIETNEGDFIGIRYKMYLSHSYDHRVVNGALGGMFAKRVADYLEAWDPNREV